MPTTDRPVWFLVPGGIPYRGGASGRSAPDGAEYYCFQGDSTWRPIAELFTREGGVSRADRHDRPERNHPGPPVRPVPEGGAGGPPGGVLRHPEVAGVAPDPLRGRPLSRLRGGGRGAGADDRFYGPLALDLD